MVERAVENGGTGVGTHRLGSIAAPSINDVDWNVPSRRRRKGVAKVPHLVLGEEDDGEAVKIVRCGQLPTPVRGAATMLAS